MEGRSNPASEKQACSVGFLSSHHGVGGPHHGMDYEHVNILRLDTTFKDAIQSLTRGANNYVQCVVTVPCNLGGLPKLPKVRMYSRPSIALSCVAGSLLVKGNKPFASIKILAEDTYQQQIPCKSIFFSKKAPFNFDYFFLSLNHFCFS